MLIEVFTSYFVYGPFHTPYALFDIRLYRV